MLEHYVRVIVYLNGTGMTEKKVKIDKAKAKKKENKMYKKFIMSVNIELYEVFEKQVEIEGQNVTSAIKKLIYEYCVAKGLIK